MSQVPLHLEAAKDITALVQHIQDSGGVINVDDMADNVANTKEVESQPEPVETETPTPGGKKPKPRKNTPAKKDPVTAKALKAAGKELAALERTRLKEQAAKRDAEQADINAGIEQIENGNKATGNTPTIPRGLTVSLKPAEKKDPPPITTASPAPAGPGNVVTQVSAAPTPVNTTPAATTIQTENSVQQAVTTKVSTAVTKVTNSVPAPKMTFPEPHPPDSLAFLIESNAPPGLNKKWVSDPDQNGWKKFDEELDIYGGFKSTMDNKIYRVKVIAENHRKKAKGVITCHNNTQSVLADADLLSDPGVNIVDPTLVVPAGDETCNFPDDTPILQTDASGQQTVHTTTAASVLISSVPLTAGLNSTITVNATQPSVSFAQISVPPVVSAAQPDPAPTVTPAQTLPVTSPAITNNDPSPTAGFNIQFPGTQGTTTIPFEQLAGMFSSQLLMNTNMMETFRAAQTSNSETTNLLLQQLIKGKEEDEDKNLARPRNILSKVTDLPAFVDNMADSLSPARFLPTGTNLKTWGNMIPTKFEPRSNLSLEEYGITVNNFAAVHKAHDRTDNKLQLKHFKTENLHKIEQSNKLKYDGTGFTQVSGLTDINTVAQALEVRHTTGILWDFIASYKKHSYHCIVQ